MSKQTINIGASPNDGTGTPLRTSFDYTNQNFTELYTALGGGVGLPGATTQVIFNDGGTNLAGDAGLVYNKTTDALTVAGLVTAGSASITGAATVGTTLGVTGASTLASVGVTGAATVGTTLGVTGDSTLTGAVGVGATPIGKFDVYNTVSDTTVFIRSDTTKLGQIVFRDNADAGNQGKLKYDHLTDTLSLSAGGNENLFLSSTGNLSLATGNLVMTTSGKGIDFSATAGTGTSELLNDYEEGTWTPTDGSGAGLVFTVSACRYTKVGRAVTVQGNITYPVTVSAVSANISGFPFNSADGIYLDIKYSDASIASLTYLFPLTSSVNLSTPGLSVLNSTVSGKYISFSGTYMI